MKCSHPSIRGSLSCYGNGIGIPIRHTAHDECLVYLIPRRTSYNTGITNQRQCE
jgi:hypothetical protein